MTVQRWVLKDISSNSVTRAVYFKGTGYLYGNLLTQEFFLSTDCVEELSDLEYQNIFFLGKIDEDTQCIVLNDEWRLEKDSYNAETLPVKWQNKLADHEPLISPKSLKNSAFAHVLLLSCLLFTLAFIKKENPNGENKKVVTVKLTKPPAHVSPVQPSVVKSAHHQLPYKNMLQGALKTKPQSISPRTSPNGNAAKQKSIQALRSLVRSGFVKTIDLATAQAVNINSTPYSFRANWAQVEAQNKKWTQAALIQVTNSANQKYQVRDSYQSVKVAASAQGSFLFPSSADDQEAFGLDRDQIIAVVNRHRGQVVACYEQALQSHPALEGKLAVQFVIGPQGKVVKASIKDSNITDAGLIQCILSRLKMWAFPAPVGRVHVDVYYPFYLRKVSVR